MKPDWQRRTLRREAECQGIKVFCFFFSKKKALLSCLFGGLAAVLEPHGIEPHALILRDHDRVFGQGLGDQQVIERIAVVLRQTRERREMDLCDVQTLEIIS
jgi:hypothetical protein